MDNKINMQLVYQPFRQYQSLWYSYYVQSESSSDEWWLFMEPQIIANKWLGFTQVKSMQLFLICALNLA